MYGRGGSDTLVPAAYGPRHHSPARSALGCRVAECGSSEKLEEAEVGMKPNASVGVAMSKTEIAKLLLEIQANDAIRNHEPYVKALALAVPAVLFPAPDLEVTAQARDSGPVLLWHESLLERRAWELLMTLVSRGEPIIDVARCFNDAEQFAAEAAKRRTGGV